MSYKRDMTETTEESEFCTVLYAAQRSGIALKTWYQVVLAPEAYLGSGLAALFDSCVKMSINS
jgi:hypothetical protein